MHFYKEMFSITDSEYSTNVSVIENEAILYYPCNSNHECSSYNFWLSPGVYLIKAYGASSSNKVSLALSSSKDECISDEDSKKYGGNAECYKGQKGVRGSGGFISGILRLNTRTFFYANIGGSGVFQSNESPGGFNGGGNGGNPSDSSSASGGGATDLRVIEDDFWHRIIVAAGGGGTDNSFGTGGAGGYPEGQGYWIENEYKKKVADQTNGYEFGIGESANQENKDIGGAGGGWFGGYASNDYDGGAGGGSSFILTENAEIPIKPGGKEYAFSEKTEYLFTDINYATGIWEGNGKLHIICLSQYFHNSCKSIKFSLSPLSFTAFIQFSKS